MQMAKRPTPVHVPITGLDLTPWTHERPSSVLDTGANDPAGEGAEVAGAAGKGTEVSGACSAALYDLHALVQHTGTTLHFGHYTALTQHPDSKSWYHYNDSRVTRVIKRPADTVAETASDPDCATAASELVTAEEEEVLRRWIDPANVYVLWYKRRRAGGKASPSDSGAAGRLDEKGDVKHSADTQKPAPMAGRGKRGGRRRRKR